jgi:uncharacterized glyoxalase superfamily protein PhnB
MKAFGEGLVVASHSRFRVIAGRVRRRDAPGELGDHSWYGYITVTDVDALYAEYRRAGAELTQPLMSKPWGMREFGIRTIDGHRVMFGQEL